MEKDIYLKLKQKIPLLDGCIWSPRVLASFMHHVPDIGYVFVDLVDNNDLPFLNIWNICITI